MAKTSSEVVESSPVGIVSKSASDQNTEKGEEYIPSPMTAIGGNGKP